MDANHLQMRDVTPTFGTGAHGQQQPVLRQARVDLRHQWATEDAALSTLHCRPVTSALCVLHFMVLQRSARTSCKCVTDSSVYFCINTGHIGCYTVIYEISRTNILTFWLKTLLKCLLVYRFNVSSPQFEDHFLLHQCRSCRLVPS